MLKKRSHIREEMDNLNLEGEDLKKTLDGLSVINTFLGNTTATFKAVKKELRKKTIQTPRIIDLGCGGGDNLRRIARWCNKHNRKVELIGIDGNANILQYAREKNDTSINIIYKQADILSPTFELDTCDILISSHFIYHFTDDALISFLEKTKEKVSQTIIFSDLNRSILPFYLFKYFGFLMPFNEMVKTDGLRAIQRSFKKRELKNILKEADFRSYSIQWKWIFRHLLVINTAIQK